MSTTGCSVGDEGRVAADLAQGAHDGAGPFGRAALALQHEDAHRLVDRRQVAVEDLLGVVRFRWGGGRPPGA